MADAVRQSTSPGTLVIAQPTFLPWAGWFDLADQADLLILLDDVGFSKQSWQQRNRLRTSEGLSYISCPVRTAGRLGQRILDVELANTMFAEKMVRTIAANYARAAHFERYFPELRELLLASVSSGLLVDVNIALIDWLARHLDVNTPRLRSGSLDVSGQRGGYVARLCEHVGAARYLSPAGAEEYLVQDRAEFDSRGIAIELHVYEHPVYHQCFQPFMPYASALDLLLNEGEQAARILRSGRRPVRGLAGAST